jgi:ribosomal protein S18 acetylase RimI-like enzyme
MKNLVIRTYQHDDEAAVIELWRQCGLVVPWNNPHSDIARKCADSPQLFFVGVTATALVATCMAGYDGHRGWIYYLAVAEAQRRQGIAARMVRHAGDIVLPQRRLLRRPGSSDEQTTNRR